MQPDKISHIINDGIMNGIAVTIDNGCYGSALVLLYAGIDAMAFLALPAPREDVTRRDFVAWVNRYIRFRGEEQISGLELYAARCGMLHNYSACSRLTREGKARIIAYVDEASRDVMISKDIPNLAVVSIRALARAFSEGVGKFILEVQRSENRRELVSRRLDSLVHSIDLPPQYHHL